ncbi:hypothetical protein B7P34_33035 [Streptosporangium nondiastaticum]|uniref:Uncharacterized protein n=1 Tax=Streptosporangium nondiastaticum TaxID=35764 RepID=A0A9X7JIW2_9ACTN|nr:hypothetical protein [Streptosporangium nondiastaticum]PSJ24495.1 hypothetical protein B7P34_33035 [Streptosporangium nondiastaticum]
MKPRPVTLVPALGCAAALLVLGTPGPAAAHGDTIHFTVGGAQSDGHVRAVASWDNDDDPVDEPVAGTLTATGRDGRTLGPWQLVAVAGEKAAYTTREALPPGNWKVVVHSGFPDLGHGEGTVDVAAQGEAAKGEGAKGEGARGEAKSGPAPAATEPPAAKSAPSGPSAAPREAASSSSSSRTGIAAGAGAAAAVIAAVGGVLLFRAWRSRNGRAANA